MWCGGPPYHHHIHTSLLLGDTHVTYSDSLFWACIIILPKIVSVQGNDVRLGKWSAAGNYYYARSSGYGRNIKVGIRWVCKSSVLHWKTHQWTKTWPPRSRAAWMKSLLCETYCIKSCLGESAALIIKYFLSCKVNWSFSLVCSVKNNLSNS